jgi:hypothetical protein
MVAFDVESGADSRHTVIEIKEVFGHLTGGLGDLLIDASIAEIAADIPGVK